MREGPASIIVERRVEWIDTDASGHYHHSAVQRWVESAEAVLLDRLRLGHLFGRTPRVRYEVDYLGRLWFGDLVQIELEVARLGRSSLQYRFAVTKDHQPTATGTLTIVQTSDACSGPLAWDDTLRRTLTTSGSQRSETWPS